MALALEQAELASKKGEVPVGAVLVLNKKIVLSHNTSVSKFDPTAHAEINVIRKMSSILKNYRLIDSEMFVTLEPCLMCLGAAINARIKKIYFATKDSRFRTVFNPILKFNDFKVNHKILFESGLMEEDSKKLLNEFFKNKRHVHKSF
jgi:tRNA(adenine34) deaminase